MTGMLAAAWRRAAALLMVSCCGTVVGAAAGLDVTAGGLGAATATIPRCTSAGLTVFHNLTAGNVTSVTVRNIPASCAGATLRATVDNAAAAGSGSTSVPAGGGSVTVTLSPTPSVTTAARTDLVFEGP